MPLGVDSTIVYAAKIEGKWRNDGKVYQSDIDRRSPYNTRIFKGLPPGPVGSPGLSSLMAALNPEHTTYLYYVRNPYQDNGAHNFYSSAAEFEKWCHHAAQLGEETGAIASPLQRSLLRHRHQSRRLHRLQLHLRLTHLRQGHC